MWRTRVSDEDLSNVDFLANSDDEGELDTVANPLIGLKEGESTVEIGGLKKRQRTQVGREDLRPYRNATEKKESDSQVANLIVEEKLRAILESDKDHIFLTLLAGHVNVPVEQLYSAEDPVAMQRREALYAEQQRRQAQRSILTIDELRRQERDIQDGISRAQKDISDIETIDSEYQKVRSEFVAPMTKYLEDVEEGERTKEAAVIVQLYLQERLFQQDVQIPLVHNEDPRLVNRWIDHKQGNLMDEFVRAVSAYSPSISLGLSSEWTRYKSALDPPDPNLDDIREDFVDAVLVALEKVINSILDKWTALIGIDATRKKKETEVENVRTGMESKNPAEIASSYSKRLNLLGEAAASFIGKQTSLKASEGQNLANAMRNFYSFFFFVAPPLSKQELQALSVTSLARFSDRFNNWFNDYLLASNDDIHKIAGTIIGANNAVLKAYFEKYQKGDTFFSFFTPKTMAIIRQMDDQANDPSLRPTGSPNPSTTQQSSSSVTRNVYIYLAAVIRYDLDWKRFTSQTNLTSLQDQLKRVRDQQSDVLAGRIKVSEAEVPYRHTRAWMERPEHSGLLRVRPIVVSSMGEAYERVLDMHQKAREDVPIEVLQYGEEIRNDFAKMVAIYMSLAMQRAPRAYTEKSVMQRTLKDLGDIIARMREYQFVSEYDTKIHDFVTKAVRWTKGSNIPPVRRKRYADEDLFADY